MNAIAMGGARRALALFAALAMTLSGCAADNGAEESGLSPETREHLASIEAELQAQVAAGLESQVPPPLPPEQRELVELVHHRRRVADDMRRSVVKAVSPLVMAAALFAINGPVDLLLAVVPVHRLGKAVDIAKHGLEIRRKSRRSKQLVEIQRKLDAALPASGKEFLRVAGALKAAERKALKVIHARTGNADIVYTLMRRHVDGAADVRWIARKLEQGKLDEAFVRRYTFDADIVEEITDHDAHISWRTLQAVVEREAVDDGARRILRHKLTGLMGERVARARIMSRTYPHRMLNVDASDVFRSARGLRYSDGSLDIAAYSNQGRAIFVEVKSWGTNSWVTGWKKVIAQLRKHDRGIRETLALGGEVRSVAGKVLMVTRQGFYGWERDARKNFRKEIEGFGWRLDFIDANDVKDFRVIIDDLR